MKTEASASEVLASEAFIYGGVVLNREFTYDSIEVLCADLKIIFIKDDKTMVTGNTGVHMHSFWELFYLDNGMLTVTSETECWKLTENQGLIIPPNTYHSSESAENVSKKSVFFTFEKVKSEEKEALFAPIYTAFAAGICLVTDQAGEIGACLSAILAGYPGAEVGKIWRMRAKVTELVFKLYDYVKNEAVSICAENVERSNWWGYKYAIERLLDIYYMIDNTLEQLGEKLFLSPQAVARIIASTYGKSFNELKVELKMRNAQKMLRETSFSVGEIGQKIGYTSQRGFLAAFSKYEGCTPSEYRKANREEKTAGEYENTAVKG